MFQKRSQTAYDCQPCFFLLRSKSHHGKMAASATRGKGQEELSCTSAKMADPCRDTLDCSVKKKLE